MTNDRIHYSDNAIIEGLKLRSDFIIRFIYKEFFPLVRFFITNNGGSNIDAEDIFHDVVLILYNKSKESGFELKSSLKSYIYSCSRTLWIRELKKRNSDISPNNKSLVKSADYNDYIQSLVDDEIDALELTNKMIEAFNQLDEKEKALIKLIAEKIPNTKIAELLNVNQRSIPKLKQNLINKLKAVFLEIKNKESHTEQTS